MDEMEVLDLSGLELWGTVLTNKVISGLEAEPHVINLDGSHIRDDCAVALSKYIEESGKVIILSINETRVSTTGFTSITKAVLKSRSVVEYYADNNVLNVESFQDIAKTDFDNSKLELLSMCGSDVSTLSIAELAKILPKLVNLRQLRLDSNSLFSKGCDILTNVISKTNIEALSIADNQIWYDSLSSLFEVLTDINRLTMLDISYNAVKLDSLSALIRRATRLNALAVSGCKADSSLMELFLKSLCDSNIETLIIDGLNFDTKLVTWPQVSDTLWNDPANFATLLVALSESKIQDLRVGYMTPIQISAIRKQIDNSLKLSYSRRKQLDSTFTLSIHDFGRTGDCWVFRMPDYSIEAPSQVFEWKVALNEDSATEVSEIIKNASCEGKPVTNLILSETRLSDHDMSRLLAAFDGYRLDSLESRGNIFGALSRDALKELLETGMKKIDIEECKLSDEDLSDLISFLVKHPSCLQDELAIDIDLGPAPIVSTHKFSSLLSSWLALNPPVSILRLSGTIGAPDMYNIVCALPKNSHLKILEMTPVTSDNIGSQDPKDPADSDAVMKVTDALYKALKDKKSSCILSEFLCPMVTDIFIGHKENIEKIRFIAAKLATNREAASKK